MKCPHCAANLTGHTQVGGPKGDPSEGDVCVCVYCITPLIVRDGVLYKLSGRELGRIMEPALARAIVASVVARAAREDG